MLFKSKEKKKFDPRVDLRVQKVKYLYEGKVVKECNQLQFRTPDFDGDYWQGIKKDDCVIEITDHKTLKVMGLEVPSE